MNPSAMPPAIPPMNLPIAVPIFCNKSPPSDINHSRPDIWANPPRAARTTANSVITAPNPRTPIIAAGANDAIAARAAIIAVINPIPIIPFINISGSMLLRESITPINRALNTFTTA